MIINGSNITVKMLREFIVDMPDTDTLNDVLKIIQQSDEVDD